MPNPEAVSINGKGDICGDGLGFAKLLDEEARGNCCVRQSNNESHGVHFWPHAEVMLPQDTMKSQLPYHN